jgi:hypothetical protein
LAPRARLHIATQGDALLLQPERMGLNDAVRIKFADPDGGTGPMAIEYRDTGRPALWVAGGDLNVQGPAGGGATLNVLTGGVGTWNKFVVNDQPLGRRANQYVTIGAGGAAGLHVYNPTSSGRGSCVDPIRRSGEARPAVLGSGHAAQQRFFALEPGNRHRAPPRRWRRTHRHSYAVPGGLCRAASGAGAIVPTAGNSADAGLMWPRDPGGGGGDAAWIRYYSRGGESMTFEIGTANDADDHIALMASGGVGIGINQPRQKLEVSGGHIVQSSAVASNDYAKRFLAGMPAGTLLIGGPWSDWLYFYFKSHDGRLLKVQLQGSPW